jgi:HK97 family phage major capsid protein
MEKLAELRRKLGALTDELGSLVSDAKAFEAKETEITEIEGQIERAKAAQTRSAALARPANGEGSSELTSAQFEAAAAQSSNSMRSMVSQLRAGKSNDGRPAEFADAINIARKSTGFSFDKAKHFGAFGDQLKAIANYYLSKGVSHDNRLVRAPTGAGEVDPTGGGFLVQTDFQDAIFMIAHDMGKLLPRVNKIPISANANGLKINAVDETSRATGSRWGGVQSYWVNEGDTVSKTKPKFRRVEFDLHKLFSLMYITDELLQDSTALTSIMGQAFSEEIMFMTEDAIFEGSGAGLPLGIMNSPALIQVAKQQGQATQTIVKENIDAMWSRCYGRSRDNAVWLVNQLVEPQLNQLNQAVGTGGQLVYLPPGGTSAAPYATLYGKPILTTEYSNAVGTPGDIMLADLSQYTLVDKGGVQAATSMHIAFLTDEMVFRITYRVDGKPMWYAPLTPFKGGASLSPFVALATR